MTAHPPRRRLVPIAIGLFAVILLATWGDLVMVRSRQNIGSSYGTTRITGPKLPDGSIDYVQAMEDCFSRDVTPQNNAAIPILQALGPAALSKTQPANGITDRLGMPPLPKNGDYYIAYEDYFHAHRVEDADVPDQFDPSGSLHWPVAIDAGEVEWVKANEKPLALLTAASTRSRYFIPFNGGNRPSVLYSVLLPHIGLLRGAGNALLTRAVIRLNGGDTDGFADDIRTAHRMAALLEQDSTMVGRMSAIYLECSVCRVQRLGIASGKLSLSQMRQMLSERLDSGETPSVAPCIDTGERFIGLDALQAMAHAKSDEDRAALFNGLFNSNNPAAVFRVWPIDYDGCMRTLNHGYDELLAAVQMPTYAESERALDIFDLHIQLMRDQNMVRTMLSSDWPSLMLLPSLRKATERIYASRAEERLTELALGLELFRSEHGAYPASLSALQPVYLSEIPADNFSDAPFKYARTSRGYLLYSVGPNMNDDGGKDTKPADDIAVSVP
jgi:hypothetical protein